MTADFIAVLAIFVVVGFLSTLALVRLKKFGSSECNGCPYKEECDFEESGECQLKK